MDCKSYFSEAVPLAYSVFDFNVEKRDNLLPVVIVHCLLSNRKTWEYIATKLAKQTGRVVYTVDQRNHGESPRSENGHIQDHYTKDLEFFLKLRGIRKCFFIGHSLGGQYQLLLAHSKPELVGSLILVDSLPTKTPVMYVEYMAMTSEALRDCIADLNDVDVGDMEEARKFCELDLRTKIKPKVYRDTLINDLKMTENGYDWNFNNDILEKHYVNFIAYDTTHQGFDGPTLVIAPEHSGIVTSQALKDVHSILPNMSCVRLPNVTHQLYLEVPDKFIGHCVEFWSTIKARNVEVQN